MTTTKKTRQRKSRYPQLLAKPDHLILADNLADWAELARANKLTGLAYVMILNDKVQSGLDGQCWWEPQVALPEVERLRQRLLSQMGSLAWCAENQVFSERD